MVDADGTFDKMKGRAKEAAGELMDDDDLRREGKTDQVAGKAKQVVEDVKDAVDDGIDRVRDRDRS
jgi:uncharacterized protein YjbJ (UPF0337 family)